jgi:arylsulfatase A-like enzyme
LNFLKEVGVYDRAILVFVSDHGEEFEEHDSVFHERIYGTVTRVPLMIRFPGGEPNGTIAEPVEAIDLMPTLLAQVGVPSPKGVQGQSLLSLVRGEGSYRQLAVSESPFFGRRIAVASGHHRLVYTVAGEGRELYSYREDPLEQSDIAAERPDVADELVAAAQRWQTLVESRRQKAKEVADMKEETIEQLRTLGYLD